MSSIEVVDVSNETKTEEAPVPENNEIIYIDFPYGKSI